MHLTSERFRKEIGLGELSPELVECLLQLIFERLEMRIDRRVKEVLTRQEADDFESLLAADDLSGAFALLRSEIPHYDRLVAEETQLLEAELEQQAPAILAIEGTLVSVAGQFETRFAALEADRKAAREP